MGIGSRGLVGLAVGIAVVVGIGLVAAPAVSALSRQGDREGFRTYVNQLTDSTAWANESPGPADDARRDAAWVTAHPDMVLAAGYRACAWLDAQPTAPDLDPTGRYTADSLMRAYVGVTFGIDHPPAYDDPGAGDIGLTLSPQGRLHVVAGAWANLCEPTRRDHTAPAGSDDD